MTQFLCAALSLALTAVAANDSTGLKSESSAKPSVNVSRTYIQWRGAVSTALRDEATAEGENRASRLMSLVTLAQAVQTDASLSDRQRTQLLTRLQRRVRKGLQRADREIALGQRLDPGKPAGAPHAAGRQAANFDAVIPELINPEMWERLGGPGNMVLFQRHAGGAGGPHGERNGEGLVELIQTVIEPESWERVGGFGAIALFGQ